MPAAAPRPCPCLCGNALPYACCCGLLHQGAPAANAEALMHSRYSACVLGLTDYLLATWHASTRPTSLAPNQDGLKWLGLAVRRHTVQGADHATVDFVACSKLSGRAHFFN